MRGSFSNKFTAELKGRLSELFGKFKLHELCSAKYYT